MDPYTEEAYNYSLRGGHDGQYLYLLFEWEDETDSRDRQSWYFDQVASKWKQENKYANHKNDKFYEDKFGMMFPIGSPEGFASGTCTVTCHAGLTNPAPGQKSDTCRRRRSKRHNLWESFPQIRYSSSGPAWPRRSRPPGRNAEWPRI